MNWESRNVSHEIKQCMTILVYQNNQRGWNLASLKETWWKLQSFDLTQFYTVKNTSKSIIEEYCSVLSWLWTRQSNIMFTISSVQMHLCSLPCFYFILYLITIFIFLFYHYLTSLVTSFFLTQSEGWGEEAKTKFLGMVNNKVVLMTIFREEDGVLIVDLKKHPFNKISNNMPVSLKDALVFLDLARYVFSFSLCSYAINGNVIMLIKWSLQSKLFLQCLIY